MKNKILKLVILLCIIQLVGSCSTFDDTLTYNTPPSPDDVQARVISGDLAGRKFTVLVDDVIIATSATYGKFTPYVTVPFGAKKYYFVNEDTKDTIKFDITKLAPFSTDVELGNGMLRGMRYSLMIKHPADRDGIYKDNFELIVRKEMSLPPKSGYFKIKNLAIYETPDSRKAIHRPGFVYNDDNIYDNQHFNGRFVSERYGVHYIPGGPNPQNEGVYSEFKTDTKFNYYFLDNYGNRKLFSFEGVNFVEGGLYTIVASGSIKENPDRPLEITVYHDNGLLGEKPVKLKRLPDDLRPIQSKIFNLAYGLANYGYYESFYPFPVLGNTGDYKGIAVTANMPSGNGSIELGKGLLYPYGGPISDLTNASYQQLKSNLEYNINPVLNMTTLTSPQLGVVDYTALNVPSQNFYVATTSAGTTTLLSLPNPVIPKNDTHTRVVNMVPDALVKVELTAPDGTTVTIADALGFGQQSPYFKLQPITEFEEDDLGNPISKSGYKIRISDTSGNSYCFEGYELIQDETNTLFLSGTASSGDDDVMDASGNVTHFAKLNLFVYSDTKSAESLFPIVAVPCE